MINKLVISVIKLFISVFSVALIISSAIDNIFSVSLFSTLFLYFSTQLVECIDKFFDTILDSNQISLHIFNIALSLAFIAVSIVLCFSKPILIVVQILMILSLIGVMYFLVFEFICVCKNLKLFQSTLRDVEVLN